MFEAVEPKIVKLRKGSKLLAEPRANAEVLKTLTIDEPRMLVIANSDATSEPNPAPLMIGVAKAYGARVTFTDPANVLEELPADVPLDAAVMTLVSEIVRRTVAELRESN